MAFEEKKGCTIFGEKYTIYVSNRLPWRDPNPLSAHCASKGWEVFNSTLASNHIIKWTFCNNFMGKSMFFCHFFWGQRDASFEVFNGNTAKKLCYGSVCYWEVRRDGMYLSGSYPPADFKKMQDWKP
ncbi:hypothetical protein F511_02933 [Dorcoceras hygrometricum]|uniref:S-protein homolog n=1 Tax=Dorcoceras hygrometricum TaxID=472368 RepID=A0A2Z7AIX9_9LAMI|nr:hypothetical protein F511_02933 [Dorcoceras hygrometricum]